LSAEDSTEALSAQYLFLVLFCHPFDPIYEPVWIITIPRTLLSCAAAANPEGPLPTIAIFFPVR